MFKQNYQESGLSALGVKLITKYIIKSALTNNNKLAGSLTNQQHFFLFLFSFSSKAQAQVQVKHQIKCIMLYQLF